VPKVVQMDKTTALEMENAVLRLQLIQAEYAKLAALACKAAKIDVDRCSVDLQQRVITEKPGASEASSAKP
jgi:hypothetical protein